VEVATFTPFRLPRWYVLGTDGCITMDTISSERAKVRKITGSQIGYVDALAYSANGVEKRPQKTIKAEFAEYDAPEVLPPQDWATGLYSNVINALDGKEELIVKPAQVLRCFEVMFAAIESSKTGKSVEF
ncbi:MAG: hypothetical protein FWF15_12200, partial [Oscillospiraceae bacterium]|nr:hypothetical protein [Oscillospiraceae bacterium]